MYERRRILNIYREFGQIRKCKLRCLQNHYRRHPSYHYSYIRFRDGTSYSGHRDLICRTERTELDNPRPALPFLEGVLLPAPFPLTASSTPPISFTPLTRLQATRGAFRKMIFERKEEEGEQKGGIDRGEMEKVGAAERLVQPYHMSLIINCRTCLMVQLKLFSV